MPRSVPMILVLIGCLAVNPAIFSQEPNLDTVISGKWQIEYLILDPDEHLVPVSVRTLGYTQSVQRIHRGYRVTVTSSIEPVMINGAVPSIQPVPEDVKRNEPALADALAGIRRTPDAVRVVLGWIDDTITYENNPGNAQDPASVRTRKTANCVGRSRLSANILNALGIPCRTVRGCLFSTDGPSRFHRWIEIDYPGIGALPSDPGATQDFVTPYHLILLPSESANPDANTLSELGVTIRIRAEKRAFWPVDQQPVPGGFSKTLERRKTTPDRYHSALTVDSVADAGTMRRMLIQGNGVNQSLVSDAFGRFSVLPISPGSYDVIISADGCQPEHRRVQVGVRERVHIHCVLKKSPPGDWQ